MFDDDFDGYNRMPVANDEFGCEIDDFRSLPADEMKYTLANLLGAQITSATYEPQTGCILLSIGHFMTIRCGAMHVKPGLLSDPIGH
ncbi:hypothetical protein EGY25_04295 [Brevundimonas intermedia]|uniref:Uncharacterized protein n=1 Tax=Brevundimonas intermedia TaxID=74315 RepID=A0A4Y9S371_9CAUL|nr:hypothetical protein [Brevundimonas intermedia]TFW14419.1 hypothetical protein EGY25_04295 [Brevundimonas intermedia]